MDNTPSFVILPTDSESVQKAKASKAQLAQAAPNLRKKILDGLISDAQKKHDAAFREKDWETATEALEEVGRLKRFGSDTKAEALIL